MTQQEISKRHYKNRRKNNLCPRCGKPLDRDGFYCVECLEKNNEYRREVREWCREHKICPACGKNKLYGDEKNCIECRAIKATYKENHKLTEEQRERYNELTKKNNKNTYQERKKLGICTRCGKRKAISGKCKCAICQEKDNAIHRKRTENKQNIREYRKENHLCYYCGEPIDREQGQLCQKCWQIDHERGKKLNSDNKYWRIDNQFLSYKI